MKKKRLRKNRDDWRRMYNDLQPLYSNALATLDWATAAFQSLPVGATITVDARKTEGGESVWWVTLPDGILFHGSNLIEMIGRAGAAWKDQKTRKAKEV